MIKVQMNIELDTDMHDVTRIVEAITDHATQIGDVKVVYIKCEDNLSNPYQCML